jgi:hypothetical protein
MTLAHTQMLMMKTKSSCRILIASLPVFRGEYATH